MSDTTKWVDEIRQRLHERIQEQAQRLDLPPLVGTSPWTLGYAEVARFKILLAEERKPFTEQIRVPRLYNPQMTEEEKRGLKFQTILLNPDHRNTSPHYWLELEKYFHEGSWKKWEAGL